MENASKALLMAAAVLLGVMLLSLAVYLFNIFGNTSQTINQRINDNEIAKFNVDFTKYEGKTQIKVYDVISVSNLAKQNNNKYYGTDTSNVESKPYYITVIVIADSTYYRFETLDDSKYQDFLQKFMLKSDKITPYYFKCNEITISNITKLVKSITFSLNN